MEDRNGFGRDFFRVGTPQCGLMTGALGVVLAFLLLFLGFWKTLFICLFFAAGYAFGAYRNKVPAIKAFINKLFPPRGE